MGAFGAISSFAFRRRGRSGVRLAGIAFCKANEPTFWPRSDYGRFFFWGSLTSTQTAGIGNLHVRTCSRTTRVTAMRMGGFEAARWRENFCCVTPKRVAGVGFATFMEHTFPSRVFEDPCFLLDSPSRSRIGRKMMRFWFSRDGICLGCRRNTSLHPVFSFFVLSFSLSLRFLYIVLLVLDPPFALTFFGGGGSCRRQGKSAAPRVGPGVGCSLGPSRVESA